MNSIPGISWHWYSFHELSNSQLYSLLKLRQDVFIIEQECLYPDMDDLDQHCMHLLGYEGEQLIACLRLIPEEFSNSGNTSLGRIITISHKRGMGLGSLLMNETMAYLVEHFSGKKIQLSAQHHLQSYYYKYGFERFGEPYDEDGILHIAMLFDPSRLDPSQGKNSGRNQRC